MTKELVKVCVDTIKKPELVYSAAKGQDVDAIIREELLGMTEIEGKFTTNDFHRAMRRNGYKVFEIIEEVLSETFLRGVEENEFFRQFAEIHNYALGDTGEFVLNDDGVVVVSEVSNGNWDIYRQRVGAGASHRVQTKTYGAHMYADFFDFAMGRVTFQDFINKVAEGFETHLNNLVATSFGHAAEALPAEFKVSGNFDLEKLHEVVDHVEAANGTGAVVIGTRSALSKVIAGADVDWITSQQKEDRQRTGMVGYYEGMKIVQLPRVHKQGTLDFAYDDSKLLVLPESDTIKPVKIVVEGDAMVREVTVPQTNQDQTLEYIYTSMYGADVIFDGAFGVYELA